jgi:hypothetical protein
MHERKRAYPETAAALDAEAYLYWTIQLERLSLNGTLIPLESTYADLSIPSIALLDVGANGIWGPQQDVEKLFAGVQNARQVEEGIWAAPCDTQMTIGFSFG